MSIQPSFTTAQKFIIATIFGGLILFFANAFADSKVHLKENISTEPKAIKVVELFTSQGCSSCPPADAYLGKLQQDASIITIACHVTYWDYLGWKDTHSLPYCDKRQRKYKKTLKLSTAYTPQMIINGRYQDIGSRQGKINKILAHAEKENSVSLIKMSKNNDAITIHLDRIKPNSQIEILLFGLGATENIPIKTGENAGSQLSYHSPLKTHMNLGNAKQLEAKISKNISRFTNIATWVTIAQNRSTGEIVAAGKI